MSSSCLEGSSCSLFDHAVYNKCPPQYSWLLPYPLIPTHMDLKGPSLITEESSRLPSHSFVWSTTSPPWVLCLSCLKRLLSIYCSCPVFWPIPVQRIQSCISVTPIRLQLYDRAQCSNCCVLSSGLKKLEQWDLKQCERAPFPWPA